jgi:peptide/nickel transport system permease protein
MGAYIIRRVLWMFVLLWAISFITFVIFYILPSADPALLRAGRGASAELVATIREQLGLNEPWYVQYWTYLKDVVFHLDLATATSTRSRSGTRSSTACPRRSPSASGR